MKIAITAGNSRLARLFLMHLLDGGHPAEDVIAVVRTPARAHDLRRMGVTVRTASYDDEDAMADALVGAERAYMVSGMAAPDERRAQHRRVITAAKRAGVSRLVFTSFIDSSEDSPFFAWAINRDTEAALAESGVGFTVLRHGMYADADIDHVDAYAEAGEVANNIGPTGGIAYISRDDLALAGVTAILSDKVVGKTLSLTGAEVSTQVQLAAAVSRWSGKEVPYRAMSDAEYLATFPRPEWGETIVALYRAVRLGHCDVVSDDFKSLVGRDAYDLDACWERRPRS